MCGISAVIQGIEPTDSVEEATSMIQRLVYRGYDSWGYATTNSTVKNVGEIPENLDTEETGSEACISHTRWATHGDVTEANAHPHTSCEQSMENGVKPRFAVVHNGIIQNHEELKQSLLNENHEFTSNTDTEVIPHFIEAMVSKGRTTAEAIQVFDEEAEGNYAIVVLDREDKQLYGLKRGSPLVFTIPKAEKGFKGAYFSSDLYGLSDKTGEAYFMEDGDIIQTSGNNIMHWNNGELQDGPLNTQSFEWTEEEPKLENHEYWMEKEIKEIPDALERLGRSLDNDQYDSFTRLQTKIESADRVILTASGTSYHAALLGVYYLQQNGVDAQALIASEFENYERVTEDTLLLAISQSGETRDVLDAIQVAKDKDAEIASLVNVPHSTIQRESDIGLEIKAQQENCVAATKTFTNQLYLLMNLAGARTEDVEDINTLNNINMLAMQDAQEFHDQEHEDIYIIGNASTYPIAREIALKLKEIPYIHAEGMMAGELKHGTLALIEEGTPVIAIDDGTGEIENTVKEVEARGARTKKLETTKDNEAMLFQTAVYGFFLALHWAHLKDLPVDRPRNLAKSVTVK